MTGNNFVLSRFTAIKNRHSRFTRNPLSDPHSWRKTQDFSKIESGPNYTTAAHAFVKATLRLGLRAPFVARKKQRMLICKNNIELFTDTVQTSPYFIWHCSIPCYQANTGSGQRTELFICSCRNSIIMPNC